MAKLPIGTRIDSKLKKKAQEAAKKQKISFSELVEKSVRLYADFDPYFLESLDGFNKNLKIGKSIILQNIFLKYQARQVAKKRVLGIDAVFNIDSLPEFRFTDTGIMTGEKLCEYLVDVLDSQYRELKYFRDRFGAIDSEDKTLKPIKIHWANEFEFITSKFKRLAKEIGISNPPIQNFLLELADKLMEISQTFRISSNRTKRK